MIEGIVSGVISGIIASIAFFVFMQGIKPTLLVSDDINVVRYSGNLYTYKVKVVNKSKTELTNVKYKLYYCEIHSNGFMINMRELPPAKPPIFMMEKYNKGSQFAEYACRFSYEVDNEKYPIDDNHYFMFSISAEHSVSNTMKSVTKKYFKENVKVGQFETGVSLKIV